MAKLQLHSLLKQMTGQIGDLVLRQVGGSLVISQAPCRKVRKPTAAQARHHERFLQAIQYGRSVVANPQASAIYEADARRRGISVYARSLGDFMQVPVVEQIDLSSYSGEIGQRIRILARDDFEVTTVSVAITGTDGVMVERGLANQVRASDEWIYVATVTVAPDPGVTIEVTASDHAGNKTSQVARMNLN